MRALVSSPMRGLSFSALETVDFDTPARRAISAIVRTVLLLISLFYATDCIIQQQKPVVKHRFRIQFNEWCWISLRQAFASDRNANLSSRSVHTRGRYGIRRSIVSLAVQADQVRLTY